MTISRFYLKNLLSQRHKERERERLFRTFDIWALEREGNENRNPGKLCSQFEYSIHEYFTIRGKRNLSTRSRLITFLKNYVNAKSLRGSWDVFALKLKICALGSEINHLWASSVVGWKCSYWITVIKKKKNI